MAVVKAATIAQSDVASAVSSASDGDTILVPAGSATWSSEVDVPSTKGLKIMGAGAGNSTITINSAIIAIDLHGADSRVSGFTFAFGSSATSSSTALRIDALQDGCRVDSCTFTNATSPVALATAVLLRGTDPTNHPWVLIDNCTCTDVRILAEPDANLLAHKLWREEWIPGRREALYVEDCTFTGTVQNPCIDGNYGGRYVFRYNTVTDMYIEAHSITGNTRACRGWEVYNNTIQQDSVSMFAPFRLRGGTGVVHNNTVTGTWTNQSILLDNVRSCTSQTTSGICDGNNSDWDRNDNSTGWRCRDQPGSGRDQSLASSTPYPDQEDDPMYEWDNTGVVFAVYTALCSENGDHIQASRDYYAGTQRTGYNTYAYPHPLIKAQKSGTLTV